jgi:hypothetical protein
MDAWFFDVVVILTTISYMSYLESERREEPRIRLEMFLNQYVNDGCYRALGVNLSYTGLYLQKLVEPVLRHSRVVGLEFELPGTNEIIWACAETRFNSIAEDFQLTGLRFTAMATKHERLVREYVCHKRQRRSNGLLLGFETLKGRVNDRPRSLGGAV